MKMVKFLWREGSSGRMTLIAFMSIVVLFAAVLFAGAGFLVRQHTALVIVDKWTTSTCDVIDALNCSETYRVRTLDGDEYQTFRSVYDGIETGTHGVYTICGVFRKTVCDTGP